MTPEECIRIGISQSAADRADVMYDNTVKMWGKVCWPGTISIAEAIDAAVAEEREACARMAATCGIDPYRNSDVIGNVRFDIATAIRARQ